MADAYCGPSNPLQSFQKHAQADRTLQQDRLVARGQPRANGFRSFDPRTGSLDQEFASFEAGLPEHDLYQPQLLDHHHQIPLPVQNLPPSASSWAADFQKLQISSPPAPSQQFSLAPQRHLAGWHADFRQQQQNPPNNVLQGKLPESNAQHYTPRFQQPLVPTYSEPQGFAYPQLHETPLIERHETQLPHDTLTDEEFQREFEAFEREADIQDWAQEQDKKEAEASLREDHAYMADLADGINHEIPDQAVNLGSDQIQQQGPGVDVDQQAEADALAKIARQLLITLQDEQSDKFQQSKFLDLMRKVRDREMEVRGDNFEVTGPMQQFTPYEPEQQNGVAESSATAPSMDFDFPDMNEVYDARPDEYTPADGEFGRAQSQIQELHPGGRNYPSPPLARNEVQMSGGILASNYQKPGVEDAEMGSPL